MQPLRFQPILKHARWGGRRLASRLHKQLGSETDYAESWEIVDHQADQSIVQTGEYTGWSLQHLILQRNAELLGHHAGITQFPLLCKFLDANDRLSLQVHPNDEQAHAFNGTLHGKTEAWVILEAKPGSLLYAGLKEGVLEPDFAEALKRGTVEEYLHRFTVQQGDCIFIPAGTVHAIGEGVLLAEIQQASDITFRLYDWGKLGSDGQPRDTHIAAGLNCIDWNRGPVTPVTPQELSTGAHRLEELVRCDKFIIRRHTSTVPFAINPQARMHVLIILAGTAEATCADYSTSLQAGETLLLPATAETLQIVPTGELTLLETTLPE